MRLVPKEDMEDLRNLLDPRRPEPDTGPGDRAEIDETERTRERSDEGGAKDGGIRWLSAEEIDRQRVEFAWDCRVVLHDLNLFVGAEQIGKGILAVRLCTELTTGRLLAHPVSVGYASTEENAGMVRMRLEAAGADLARVRILPMGSVGLPGAIPELTRSMRELGLEWLILDPVNAHFSPGFDPIKAKDVGRVLGELAKMATEHQLTVVGTLHTNRGGGVSARERYAHQLEFRRRARSAVIIGTLPDAEDHERVIVHDVHNYSVKDPALSATIRPVVLHVDGKPSSFPVLDLGDETDATAEDLFVAEADREGAIQKAKGARGKAAGAAEGIRQTWERLGRPPSVEAGTFKDLAKVYDKSTLSRARARLGVTTEPVQDEAGRITGYRWLFPPEAESAQLTL